MILTPAGKVSEESRLCQFYKVTPEVREIRRDKLRAVEQLAKPYGLNAPEKMEIEHGLRAETEKLKEVIAKLRGRGAPSLPH